MSDVVESGQLRLMHDNEIVHSKLRGLRVLVLQIDPDFSEPPHFWNLLLPSGGTRILSEMAILRHSDLI